MTSPPAGRVRFLGLTTTGIEGPAALALEQAALALGVKVILTPPWIVNS